MSENSVTVELIQQHDYRFDIHFADSIPVLTGDEPAPLGTGQGPSPVQLLCAAVGNCLSDSLLFALRKFKQAPEPLRCTVEAEVGRNTDNRLRVLRMTATLRLGVPAAQLEHLDRVLAQFEAYCTVTQSISQSIPVTLQVFDSTGMQLRQNPLTLQETT
ncbi:OsmC family protein [Polaromonas sp.]|uniref:OsmC family protein n=1 Tax=Polaromonas sp. TaxID=1869339 RepID=UPI0013BD728E|nr:OsmC family protein [Polaromonas sp.]NDP61203.1 OsmC family protein [Polaromonas sp.]